MKFGQPMKIERLIELGFDNSEHNGGFLVVRCSQCNTMVVNGTPLHEKGCPNETSECNDCGCPIPHNDVFCTNCVSDPDADFDVL
jgi:hypothetical protein